MHRAKWAILFVTFLVVPLLFQNCGRTFESSGSSTSLSFCKVQTGQASPFLSSKVRINQRFFSAQQKLVQDNLVPLSVIVDVSCVKDSEDEVLFLERPIRLSEAQRQMGKAALTLELQSQPSIAELEAAIEESPCVMAITENNLVQKSQLMTTAGVNDPQAAQQRHLAFLGHEESQALQEQITSRVVIAFVDSGVDYTHPDLSGRMWNDGNGNPGYDFVANTTNPMDDDGHGTHVAGIAAAIENNSIGVAGLTGDYVEIMAIKVLDRDGNGSSQGVFNGIQYAIQNGADIINLSLQNPQPGANPLMEAAIIDAVNAGIVVTAAAGNLSAEITDQALYAPAYIGPGVNGAISVASIDTNTTFLSFFSNYSATYTEVSAPGAEDSNETNGGLLSTTLGGGWTRIRGTSQATPVVSAAAALLIGYLKTQNVTYNPAGIENFIKTDGSMISNALSPYVGGGDIVHLGFLSRNLVDYFNNPASRSTQTFTGDETTGNSCVID